MEDFVFAVALVIFGVIVGAGGLALYAIKCFMDSWH